LAKSVLNDLATVEQIAGDSLPSTEQAQLLGMRATARAHAGDYANALADYAQSLELEPDNAVRRVRRGWALVMAASTGLADFDQVLATDNPLDHRLQADALAGRAYLMAVAGDSHAAVVTAERAVELASEHWPTLFNAACSYSLASGTARFEDADLERANTYADRAIALLRQSLAHGLNDPSLITKERAFVPLRHRADFAKLAESDSGSMNTQTEGSQQ
jgi:tetratricopeptide (TPR) repeat protein